MEGIGEGATEPRRVTRDEFIGRYCLESGIAWNALQKWKFCAPCLCDYEECEGWCMAYVGSLEEHLPGGIYHDPERWKDEYAPTPEAIKAYELRRA